MRRFLGLSNHSWLDVVDDESCLIWSVNLKQAPERLNHLLAHIKMQQRTPDIIAIQDPPANLPFKPAGPYSCWYRAMDDKDGNTRELSGDDNPNIRPYKPPYSHEQVAEKLNSKELIKVAFLIHGSLSGWHVTEDVEGVNRDIVATLQLPTSHGLVSIHNVYNHTSRLNALALMEKCRQSHTTHVLVGDFNLHHQLWGGERFGIEQG